MKIFFNALLALVFTTSCSSCMLPAPLKPGTVEDGTFIILAMKTDGQITQGTAWAIDRHHLVTAGHMCRTSLEGVVMLKSLEDTDSAFKGQWTDVEFGESTDLCLVKTDQNLSPLPLADQMPHIGENISYLGYPNAVKTYSKGKYIGDLDGDYTFTAPCDHGASGSAVVSDRGVWGVLVRLRTDGGSIHDGSDGCVAIPLPTIKQFLAGKI